MQPSPLEYLRHMLDETQYLMDQKKGMNKEQFLQDATLKRAFVRSIEIIGEASKKVPPDLKKRSKCELEDYSGHEGSTHPRLPRG